MKYEVGNYVVLSRDMIKLGFQRYACVMHVSTTETDSYTVRFLDGTCRRVHENQIEGLAHPDEVNAIFAKGKADD